MCRLIRAIEPMDAGGYTRANHVLTSSPPAIRVLEVSGPVFRWIVDGVDVADCKFLSSGRTRIEPDRGYACMHGLQHAR
jgi:hypothetical protein